MVKQAFSYFFEIVVVGFEIISDQVDQALTIIYIFLPYSIAADDNELVIIASAYFFYVGFAGDHLFGVVAFRVLLVVEVSKRSRQVQSTIYSPHLYCPTSRLNTPPFFRVFGFMIEAQIQGIGFSTQGTPAVTRIRNNVFIRGDKNNIGSTARSTWNFRLSTILVLSSAILF